MLGRALVLVNLGYLVSSRHALATNMATRKSKKNRKASKTPLTSDDMDFAVWRMAQLLVAYKRTPQERTHDTGLIERIVRDLKSNAAAERRRSYGVLAGKELERVFSGALDGTNDWDALERKTRAALLSWTGAASDDEVDAILTYHVHEKSRGAVRQEIEIVRELFPKQGVRLTRKLAHFRLAVRANDGPVSAARTAMAALTEELKATQALKVSKSLDNEFSYVALGQSVDSQDAMDLLKHVARECVWEVIERPQFPSKRT